MTQGPSTQSRSAHPVGSTSCRQHQPVLDLGGAQVTGAMPLSGSPSVLTTSPFPSSWRGAGEPGGVSLSPETRLLCVRTSADSLLSSPLFCTSSSPFRVSPPDCHPELNNSLFTMGFLGSSDGRESACKTGDPGLIPGLGRSPGEGQGNPLQYSCLENPTDRGAWWATVSPGGCKESDMTERLSWAGLCPVGH